MNFKRRTKALSSFNAAPMNDILFFLLLFFLLTSSFAVPTYLRLTLPRSNGTTEVKQSFAVAIDVNHKVYIDKTEVPDSSVESRITSMLAGKTDAVINLQVDKSVPIEDVVRIMNMATKLKAKVILATVKE